MTELFRGRLLCRLGLHRWYIRRATRYYSAMGTRDLQILHCARCGVSRQRIVRG